MIITIIVLAVMAAAVYFVYKKVKKEGSSVATVGTVDPVPATTGNRSLRVFADAQVINFSYTDVNGVTVNVQGVPPSVDICTKDANSLKGTYGQVVDLGAC